MMAISRSLSVSPSVCKSPGFHYCSHHSHRLAPVQISGILAVGQAEAAGHGSGHRAGQPGLLPRPGNTDQQGAEPGARLQLHSEPDHRGKTDQASCILKREHFSGSNSSILMQLKGIDRLKCPNHLG